MSGTRRPAKIIEIGQSRTPGEWQTDVDETAGLLAIAYCLEEVEIDAAVCRNFLKQALARGYRPSKSYPELAAAVAAVLVDGLHVEPGAKRPLRRLGNSGRFAFGRLKNPCSNPEPETEHAPTANAASL